MLIGHCIDNFLWVKPENQQQRQLEVKFCFRYNISQAGDQVGYSSGGGTINHIIYIQLWSDILTQGQWEKTV